MTTRAAEPGRRLAALALTILTVVLWLIALGMAGTVLVLLVRVGAPASRTAFIVAAWFMAPGIPAVGATVALAAVRRSARRRPNQSV